MCGGAPRLRSGAWERGRGERRFATRNEDAGKRNSEIAIPAGCPGIAASRSDAQSVQSAGKRSGAVPRFGGSAVAARGRGKRLAANQRCRGRDQSRVGGKPPADWTV